MAINDLRRHEALAYLLQHDTVHGRFPAEITAGRGRLMVTGDQTVKMIEIPDPAELPWKEMGVDFVVEATGRFRKRAEIAKHIEAGARKVLLTVPAKDEIDATIVLGVNDDGSRSPSTRSSPTPPARPTAWRRWPTCWTRSSASSTG